MLKPCSSRVKKEGERLDAALVMDGWDIDHQVTVSRRGRKHKEVSFSY
jgi:hypothetical protein